MSCTINGKSAIDTIAIDIALLTTGDSTARLVELNEQMKGGNRELKLGSASTLPHISLCMCSVAKTSLTNIYAELRHVFLNYSALQINVTGSYTSTYDQSQTVTSLDVEATPTLTQLHRETCRVLHPHALPMTLTRDLCRPHAVDEPTTEYISNYLSDHAYGNFRPHITVGFGTLEPITLTAMEFTVHAVALCHLGPYCTCEAVLESFDLHSV